MINAPRRLAVVGDPLPAVTISPDPKDNFLLALAEVTRADFLVTGDKSGLLSLKRHRRTAIVSARKFLEVIGKQAWRRDRYNHSRATNHLTRTTGSNTNHGF